MRYYKRARLRRNAWLFAIGLPALALFALFSLLPYEVMVARWPFGIQEREVLAYQGWFDQRPGQHMDVVLEEYQLADGRFSAKGYEGPVEQRELVGSDGALEVVFPEDSLFRGQRHVVLTPARMDALPRKYAQLIATSLGMMVPDLAMVRLNDEGAYLKEERVTPDLVLKGRADEALLLRAGSKEQPVRPYGDDGSADRFRLASPPSDDRLWAGYALLMQALGRSPVPSGDGAMVYGPWSGSVEPLFRTFPSPELGSDSTPLVRFAEARLQRECTRRAMQQLAEELRTDSATWASRFAAVDSMWGPAMAEGHSMGLAGAAIGRQREAFLQRVFHPELPTASTGGEAPADSLMQEAVPAWMERYRSQPDTIRLVRGKYDIDVPLRLPRGVALVLERGTRLFFAPGASLVVNGAFHARGTDLNPVFIRPAQEGGSYGMITVLGDGATPVVLRGVRASGGTGGWSDGAQRPAMFNFDGCAVRMDHCSLEGPNPGRAVEVRRGTVALRDCRFGGWAGPAVGLAAVKGSVRSCQFFGEGAVGASGLYLHGGQVLVSGCRFSELPGQGVTATRAAQVLVLASTFEQCGTAVQVEDLAVLHFDQGKVQGGPRSFVVQRRTAGLGGGRLVLYRQTEEAAGARSVDRHSTLVTQPAIDPVTWKLFGAGS